MIEARFLVRRLLAMLPTVAGVLLLTFALAQVIPGDPAATALGERATVEQRERFRQERGLDRPLLERYIRYVGTVIRGDLGESLHTNRPVIRDIKDLWPATFELTTTAFLITLAIGVPAGIMAARFKDRMGDHVGRLVSLVGVSIPVFWLGLLLLLVFSLWLDLLPTGGRLSTGVEPPVRQTGMYLADSLLAGQFRVFGNAVYHLILPATCLAFAVVGIVTRMVRNALIEVLHQDYIRTAHAKGLPEAVVLFRHALRNAAISVLTVAGILYAQLLGGAVLTETVFSWPGIGRYAVEGILHLDYPTILGFTVVTSVAYVSINLITDLLYGVLDPRLR